MHPAIRIEGVTKRFGSVQALAGVDLEIAPGEFFGLPGREEENPRRKEERKVVDLADFL